MGFANKYWTSRRGYKQRIQITRIRQVNQMTRNRKYIISMFFLFGLCVVFYSFIFLKKNSAQKIRHAKEKLNTYFSHLPIAGFTQDQRPLINVQIESKTFTLLLDLGSSRDICLSSSAFDEISEKTYLFIDKSYGIRGKAYESECLLI